MSEDSTRNIAAVITQDVMSQWQTDMTMGPLDLFLTVEKIQTYLPKDETVEGHAHGPQVQCLSGCTGSQEVQSQHMQWWQKWLQLTDLKNTEPFPPLKHNFILLCVWNMRTLSLRAADIRSLLLLCTSNNLLLSGAFRSPQGHLTELNEKY